MGSLPVFLGYDSFNLTPTSAAFRQPLFVSLISVADESIGLFRVVRLVLLIFEPYSLNSFNSHCVRCIVVVVIITHVFLLLDDESPGDEGVLHTAWVRWIPCILVLPVADVGSLSLL